MALPRLTDDQQQLLAALQTQLRINVEQGHTPDNMFNLAVAFGAFRAATVPKDRIEHKHNNHYAYNTNSYAFYGIHNYSHKNLLNLWPSSTRDLYYSTYQYHKLNAVYKDKEQHEELIKNVKTELVTYLIYPSLLRHVRSTREELQRTLNDYRTHLIKDTQKKSSPEEKEKRRANLAREKVKIVDGLLANLPTEASIEASLTTQDKKSDIKKRIKDTFANFSTTLTTKTNELSRLRRNGTCTDSDCTMTVLKILAVILSGIIPGLLVGSALTYYGVFRATGAKKIDEMQSTLGYFNNIIDATPTSSADVGPLLRARYI